MHYHMHMCSYYHKFMQICIHATVLAHNNASSDNFPANAGITTEGKAGRALRSSKESETSTKRMATRASRSQSGSGRESKQSVTPRAARTQSCELHLHVAGLQPCVFYNIG